MSGLSLSDRVRSSVLLQRHRIEEVLLLHIKMPAEAVCATDRDASCVRCLSGQMGNSCTAYQVSLKFTFLGQRGNGLVPSPHSKKTLGSNLVWDLSVWSLPGVKLIRDSKLTVGENVSTLVKYVRCLSSNDRWDLLQSPGNPEHDKWKTINFVIGCIN